MARSRGPGGTSEYTQAPPPSRQPRSRDGIRTGGTRRERFFRALRQRRSVPPRGLPARWYIRRPLGRSTSLGGLINSSVNAPGRSCLSLPAQPDAVSSWRTIRAELQRRVGTSAFEIWLAPIRLESFDGDVLILRAP